MKKKIGVSLSVKVNIMLAVIIITLANMLAATAYKVYSVRVDQYYKKTTSQYAFTVASFVDGEMVEALLEGIQTEEFQTVREEALAAKEDTLIWNWLVEAGLDDEYLHLREHLESVREKLGAQYIYIRDEEDGYAVNLVDPSEDLFYLGSVKIDSEEFDQHEDNERIEAAVSNTEYGWLCSAYEPILTEDGRAVALVGVDLSMQQVMKERRDFLISMLIFSWAFLAVSLGISIFIMRRIAIRPLTMLAKATDGFADARDGYTEADIIDLPIHSRDEIGNLYQEIRSMQGRMVEYLHNLTKVTAEKERISTELNVATQIQADMLPRIFPPFPERKEFDLYATMNPAKEVGGDFYDFFLVDDDHLALVMADVSGKGVPAALFMVIAKTLIKNRAQMGDSPAKVLEDVNNQLCEGNDAGLFVTVWLAVLEISTGKGWAANAGHEHPTLRHKDGQYELVKYRHSPAVSTLEGMKFKEHEFQLEPGDSLFVYTDGVPEATNARNELFGDQRMLNALNRDPGADPQTLLKTVKSEIDAFVGDAPQFDDITMLCLNYYGAGETHMFELTIEAKVASLQQVMSFVDEHLESIDCPPKAQMQLDIAVEELFVNIASYAYELDDGMATICVDTADAPQSVKITFIDRGIPYNPLEKADPDTSLPASEREIGGLGIFMVKKSMDDMSYEYVNGENRLTILKNLQPIK